MKQKKLVVVLSVALTILLIVGISAYAASNYGTQNDPLITRSYLADTLMPEILSRIQAEIDESVRELESVITKALNENGSNSADTYTLVALNAGQRIIGKAGTEIMLRSGAAENQSVSGLPDISVGESLSKGSPLAANHMYIMAADGDEIYATAPSEFLIRGKYSVS